MYLLSELDAQGKPILVNGTPPALAASNEEYDAEEGQSLNYLKLQMKMRTLRHPLVRLGVIHLETVFNVVASNVPAFNP